MNTPIPESALQLRTLLKGSGELELSLVDVPVPKPGPAEVLIRVEAAPINPSDLGLLFSAADMSTLRQVGTAQRPVVTASVPQGILKALAARIDQSLPAGNEGAGVVVAADSSPEAQAMLGKTVAASAGAMYSQYRSVHVSQCMVLPDGTKPAEGASCFVNPLTALGMVETMRREGHKALVHTAAASNLGQMLNRICLADGIGLVNVVRSEQQQKLLREQGAQHVCNSTAPGFTRDLEAAIAATGATLCFDAIGGGPLAGQVLACMEAVFARQNKGYQIYGSTTFKQVYIYGGLDPSPTTLKRNYGVAWSLGAWLLPVFMQKVGPEVTRRLQARVVAELKTTFASHYTKEISLAGALHADEIAVYARRVTGEKYLVNPQKT
jgi:NADPH2:quinone reductase